MRIEARRVRDRINVRDDNPEDAVAHFFQNIPLASDHVVAAYWPKGREFDPRPILDECLKKGHVCALPVVQDGTRILQFARWDETIGLDKGPFGILQPVEQVFVEPDIILVPMLAFDRSGYRLGQGGGYYDATLADLRAKKSVVAVGVAYAQQACLFNLPRAEHDQTMDFIVTPQGCKGFR